MGDEIGPPQTASAWWPRIISALLGIAVTVVGSLILQKLQSREPHLTYSAVEALPFNGQSGVVGIYQVILRNDGKKEIEDITSYIQVKGAKIEQYRTIVAPSLTTTTSADADAIRVNLPSLNPGEAAQISILASNPTFLPSRPEISVRAKGVNGVEQTSQPLRPEEKPFLLSLLTAFSALVSTSLIYLFLGRRRLMGRSQAANLKSICQTHGLDSRAERYSTVGRLTYYAEADRLGDEAVQSQNAQTTSEIKKVLIGICALPTINEGSKAIVLYNLARIAAKEGNDTDVDAYVAGAKRISPEEIEGRIRIDSLLKERQPHQPS
jgi:hypothetical protein